MATEGNTKATSLQGTINLFNHCLLGLNLTAGFNWAIMGFTRKL